MLDFYTASDFYYMNSAESTSHRNQRRKRDKRNPDWKSRSKTLTVCRWHETVHIKP